VSVSQGHASPAKLLIRVFPRLYRRISAPRAARPRAMDTETPRRQQAFSTTVYTNSTRSDLHLTYAGTPMSLYGAGPCPFLAAYCHTLFPIGPWSLSRRSGYVSDAPAAGRSRATLIGIGIEREKVKERWLLPHRCFYELMPPTPALLFAFGGTVMGAPRGESWRSH
jgi:hypothetical protein